MIRRTTEDALDLDRFVIGQTESTMHDDHPCTLANAHRGMAHRRGGSRAVAFIDNDTDTWHTRNSCL
jgi:hypothetical protein